MRKPFSYLRQLQLSQREYFQSFLPWLLRQLQLSHRPAATPQRAAPFPSTTSGGVFLRHHPASSPSCSPSSNTDFQKAKSFRHPRGLNAHDAGLNAHGAGLNAHGAGLHVHGANPMRMNKTTTRRLQLRTKKTTKTVHLMGQIARFVTSV